MKVTTLNYESTSHEVMKRFQNLVTSAIEINKMNRQLYSKEKWVFSPVQYAKEFCTVHINCGRRIGKTEYIRDFLEVGDVVIVPNRTMQLKSIDVLRWRHIFIPNDCGNGLPVHFLQDYKPRTIWFDEIGFSSKEEIDWVYNAFCDNTYEQTWIRLGQ